MIARSAVRTVESSSFGTDVSLDIGEVLGLIYGGSYIHIRTYILEASG